MNSVQMVAQPFGVWNIYVNRRVAGNIVEVEQRYHVRTGGVVLGWFETRLEAGEAVRRFYARARLQREHMNAQIKVAQIEAKLRRSDPDAQQCSHDVRYDYEPVLAVEDGPFTRTR